MEVPILTNKNDASTRHPSAQIPKFIEITFDLLEVLVEASEIPTDVRIQLRAKVFRI